MNVQKPARSHPADGVTAEYHMVAGLYQRVSAQNMIRYM